MMTLRSCPDFRPTVVRRSAPQPRLFDVVQRNRPPLSLYIARCTCQAACTHQGGGCFGGRGASVPIVSCLLIGTR